jgi:uncharacterized membrane protein YfcA
MNRACIQLCPKTATTRHVLRKRHMHSTKVTNKNIDNNNGVNEFKYSLSNDLRGNGSNNSLLLCKANNSTTSYIAPKSFAVGLLGGTLGSFVGMGGGVFTIPIMTSSMFGLTQRQAMATNLVAVMCMGIAGASAYATSSTCTTIDNDNTVDAAMNTINGDTFNGANKNVQLLANHDDDDKANNNFLATITNNNSNVQIDMAITAAIAGMITARLGAKLSNKITERTLKRFLAGVMYIAAPAVHLPEFIEGQKEKKKETEEVGDDKEKNIIATTSTTTAAAAAALQQQLFSEQYIMTRLAPAAIIGSSAGIFSGVTGLGGGIITVSAFSLLTPLSYKQALGTSLCAMAFPATTAAIAHHFQGNIVWRVAPFLASGAACGAFVGGKVGSSLPEKELKCCFSAAMVTLGTRVLLRA